MGIKKSKIMDYKGALEDYNKAIELDPDNIKAYDKRGNVKSN